MSFSNFFFLFQFKLQSFCFFDKIDMVIVCELKGQFEEKPSNSFYIFVLDVKFENLTVGLHVFIFLTYVLNFVQINCYLLFNH